MNKRGFELSINFVVTIILALAMLGVGFFFAGKIFTQTTDIGEQLDTQTKAKIEERLRDPSALVSIGINNKDIPRKEHDTFGIGVANRDDERGYFFLETNCEFGQGEDGLKLDPECNEGTCCGNWVQGHKIGSNKFRTEIGYLDPNEFEIASIFFNIHKKAQPGSYVYNVKAYKQDKKESTTGKKQYDSVKKIYVKVP